MLQLLQKIIEYIEKSFEKKNKKAADFIKKSARVDVHKAVRKRAHLRTWRKFLLVFHVILVLLLSVICGVLTYAIFFDSDSGFWEYISGGLFGILSIKVTSKI